MTQPEFVGTGTGWVTDPSDPRLAVLWPGSADYVPDDLIFVLEVAKIQCAAFAPAPDADDITIPENHVAAQILQTRDLVRAGVTGDNGNVGGFEEVLTVYPMSWTVKALLRPRRGVPYFGQNRVAP